MLAFQNGLEYRNFEFSMLIGNRLCTLFKIFCKIQFSNPGVQDANGCTAGVDNFITLSSAKFACGGAVCGDQ